MNQTTLLLAAIYGFGKPLTQAQLTSFYQAYTDDMEQNEGQAISAMLQRGFPSQALNTLVNMARAAYEGNGQP